MNPPHYRRNIVAKAIPSDRRGRLFSASQVLASLTAIPIGAFVRWILSPAGPPFPGNRSQSGAGLDQRSL